MASSLAQENVEIHWLRPLYRIVLVSLSRHYVYTIAFSLEGPYGNGFGLVNKLKVVLYMTTGRLLVNVRYFISYI